jgi:phage-related protein
MTAPIGSASVAIVSDTTGFKRDLDLKLAKINPKLKISDITVDNKTLVALRRRIERVSPVIKVRATLAGGTAAQLRTALKGVEGIELNVKPVLAPGSRLALQRQLEDLRPELTVKVKPILGDMDRRGLGGITQTVRADVDKKSFGEALIYANRLASALGAIAIPAALVGSIPTILGLGAALATAAQSAALLPGILGAGAFAFGAIKIGASGFGEALKNIGDPEKFAESIASLSPAARDAALAFQGLREPFLEMKTIVQDGLFSDLAPQITSLGNTFLPILTERFERITIAANTAGLDIARMLQTAGGIANVKSLGSAAAASFENLSAAVGPLGQAFLDVAQVGGTFLPGLTDGAGNASRAFADMIRSAKESGGIATFIQEGLDALTQLGSIAGNVGSALSGVFSAGNISGGGFLNTLDSITGSLANVINSVSGQSALQSFFEVTSVVATTLGDVLKALAPSLATILDAAETAITAIAPAIAPLAKAAGEILEAFAPLLPVVGELGALVAGLLTDALKALLPPVTRVVKSLADSLAPVLPVIAEAFGDVITALAPFVDVLAGALADAIRIVAPVLGEIATILGDALVSALSAIEPYLPQIADAFNQILEAIVPLLPEIAKMAVEFLTNMLPALLELVPSFLDLALALLPLLPPLVELTGALLPLFSEILTTTLVPALKTLALIIDTVVVPILEGLLIPVLETGIDVLTMLTDTLTFVLDTFNRVFGAIQDVVINVLQLTVLPIFQSVVDFLNFVFTGAVNTFGGVIDRIWRGIGTVIDTVVKGPIMGAFGAFKDGMQGVQDFAGGVKDGIAQVWGEIQEIMARPIRFFLDKVWNNGIVPAWNTMTGWIPGLGDKVHLGPLGIPFATGGPVPGVGSGDTVPAMLTPGEFVVRKQIAKPAMRFLSALNAGQAEAWQAAGGRNAQPARFAGGGPVAAEHVARGAVGKPYVWGATGPGSFDCSGLWGAITNAALGAPVYGNRRFTTASFGGGGAGGLVPGRGALTVGVQRGHMAGTLAGTAYEATPPRVRGPGALGATSFPRQFFLPQIGGAFVEGPGGGGGGGMFDFIGKIMDTFNPIKAMIDPGIDGLMPGEGPYKDLAKRLPHIVVDAVIDRAKELATDIFGVGADLFTGAVGGIAGVFGDASVRQQVAMVAHRYRWGPPTRYWDSADKLIQGESGWNPNARNPNSSAAGLFQKMQSIHGPVESTPAGQAAWGFGYIKDRYGDPTNAYNKWLSRSPHWYAEGGIANKPTLGVFGEAGLMRNILSGFFQGLLRKKIGSASPSQQPYLGAATLPGFDQIQRSDSPLRSGSSLQDWQDRINAERNRLNAAKQTLIVNIQAGMISDSMQLQRDFLTVLQDLQRQGRLPQPVR